MNDREPAEGIGAFRFGTKGETLARLAARLRVPRLCDQLIVPVSDWRERRESVAATVLESLSGDVLAIRSSTRMEDTHENSGAGAFLSLTEIPAEADALAGAIDRVIASYGDYADAGQFLVQPMVENVALAGVVLTRDLDTGGPYYVIDYDDFSGRTDTVTGGAESKTVLVHRANPGALHSSRMSKIIAMARELEDVTGCEELDIEFCMDADQDVYLLQVRPLAAQRRWQIVPDADIDAAIARIRADLGSLMAPRPGLSGATTILGEMPDWNPAEMIGNTPRPLALSLYETLITESTWADARAHMGYRAVRAPLMVSFEGRPYVDVRLSLNSFLPAGLDGRIADRLIDIQIARLADHPEWHDKIEFEIAVTCRDLAFAERTATMIEEGFSAADAASLGEGLGAITNRALAERGEGLERLLAEARRLLAGRHEAPGADPIERTRRLIAGTRQSGTLPFAILARHAFIGVSFLRSMERRGILAPGDVERFLLGVHTVAADVVADMAALAEGRLDQAEFLNRYGHLRPGTYDVTSWRYDERPDVYLGHRYRAPARARPEPFRATPGQRADIERCLAEEGLACDADGLMDYIAAAIAAREEAKFAFSRGISDALSALSEWGEGAGLSREELSFVSITGILEHARDVGRLREAAARGRDANRLARALRLPHLIVEPDDIDVVRPLRGQATFITNRSVTGPSLVLHANEEANLDGRVVLIESADPGFDWIFSRDILGLATQFGGANSHMAIRCAEFGLPAAIGCGERHFDRLRSASVVHLNCAAQIVRPADG